MEKTLTKEELETLLQRIAYSYTCTLEGTTHWTVRQEDISEKTLVYVKDNGEVE